MKPLISGPKGRMLDLVGVRAIESDFLILRAEQAPRSCREYQAVIQVSPINLLLMAQEEQTRVLEGWRAFVASRTPAEGTLCFHLRLRRQNLDPMLAHLEATAQTHPLAGYRAMARQYSAFLQNLTAERVPLLRDFFVRVPLLVQWKSRASHRLTPQEVHEQACADLDRQVAAVMSGLSRVGLLSSRLAGKALLHYYLSCLHRSFAEHVGVPQAAVEAMGALVPWHDPLNSLDPLVSWSQASAGRGLAPTEPARHARQHRRPWAAWGSRSRRKPEAGLLGSVPELLAPASLEETSHYVRIHQQTDEYVRARTVIGYPAYALPGWMDALLSSLDEPDIDVLLFLATLDPKRTVQQLSRKLTSFHATQLLDERSGRTENPYIAEAQSEVADLRSKLVDKTEQVHPFSLYVLTRADNEDALRTRDAHVARALSDLELHSVPLEYEQALAWRSCLDGRDLLRRVRKMDTSTIVCSFPFCSNNLSTDTGALVGLTPSNGLVVIDPTSSQLENGHLLVFAKSGAGKSFFVKVNLSRLLLQGMEAIVLDPANEFGRVSDQFAGTSIAFTANRLRINPFDLHTDAASSAGRLVLREKIERLLLLFDILLAEKEAGMLPLKERSYLRRVLSEAYADHGITADFSTHGRSVPHMREIYERICQEGDPSHLADRLLAHLDAFPQVTEIPLENHLVVFQLKAIKDLQNELFPIAFYLITEYVWSAVRLEQTHKPRLLLLDEAWVLMEYPEGARWLAQLSREARKYNLHLVLVTHNVNDFLTSKAGQDIMLNASMKLLLHHDQGDLETLTHAFGLSADEAAFLRSADKGEGIFFCRSSHVPIKVVASAEERWLGETNPNQLRAEEDLTAVVPDTSEASESTIAAPVLSATPEPPPEAPQNPQGSESTTGVGSNNGLRLLLPRIYDPAFGSGQKDERG